MSAKKRKRGREESPPPVSAAVRRPRFVPVAVGITALAPFVQPAFSVGPYTMRFAGILIAACAWLWAWAMEPDSFALRRGVGLASAAVAAVLVVSAAASGSAGLQFTYGAEGSLMGVPTWIALLVVFVSAASVRPSAGIVSALRLAFVWGAVSAVMLVWERISVAPQVTGGFGNSNYAGAALVALVPLGLFYAAEEDDAKWKPWWRYLVLALVAAVLLAASLANAIALAVVVSGVCLLAPAALLGVDRRTGRRVALVVGAAVLATAAVTGLALATDVLPRGVDDFASERVAGTSTLTRVEMWKMAAAMTADHPVLGVGPDGVQRASQPYLTERLLELESGGFSDYRVLMKDPHSLPLLALASVGVVGFAALLWLAAVWLASLRRALAAGEGASRSRTLRLALALSVAASLTALLFMPWAVSFGPILPMIAGLAVAAPVRDDDERVVRVPSAASLVAVALGTLAAAWLIGCAAYGDVRIASAGGQSSPELARDAYAAASRAQPTRPYVEYEALYAQGFLASESLAPLADYRAAVDAASAEVLANAGFLVNLVQPSLDEAYLTGRTDLAWERERVERAIAAAPNHPEVVLEQAHLALLSGDLKPAAAVLDRAKRLSPGAPRFLLYSYYQALATGEDATAAELEPRIEAAGTGFSHVMKGWSR